MSQQIWPGWETMRVIGSGGFGKVYEIRKAEDSKTGEYRSALKVITIPQSPEDYRAYVDDGYDEKSISAIFKDQIDDIVSEFQMMSQFRGTSHIVSYEDHMVVPREDGYGWDILIRMELLTALPEYFSRQGMGEADVIRLGQDICRALELCGRKNIIHRDIKPQNIFVNEFGDFKLGDFGIAKSMDHTTRATKIGTYSYMAPEVYRNSPYNGTVDLYSLGLVMYWLLNERRLPFLPMPPAVPTTMQTSEAQVRRLSGDPIPAPAKGSPGLKAAVLKALAYDPDERFSSPSEFIEALQRCGGSAYAGADSQYGGPGESTATQGTWKEPVILGRARTVPEKRPPAGESTRGTWSDTTGIHWTRHDPQEKQEKVPEPLAEVEEAEVECGCPWCKGTGREMGIFYKKSAQKYWRALTNCHICAGEVNLPKNEELRNKALSRHMQKVKELQDEALSLQQTPEAKNANPNCPCCSGRGWVYLDYQNKPCPECQGTHVEAPIPVRKRKWIAVLLSVTPLGWYFAANCLYEGRYKDWLKYLAALWLPMFAWVKDMPDIYIVIWAIVFGIFLIAEIVRGATRPGPTYLMVNGKAFPDLEREK